MQKYLSGWNLTRLISLVLVIHFVAAVYILELDKHSAGYLIRSTAKFSFVLFMLAFSASSVYFFWKKPLSKWLLNNRRYLGVSFAVSHYLHLCSLLLMTFYIDFNVFVDRGLFAGIGGVIAYSFITVMVITSFEKGRKLLSPKNWKRVHTAGGYLLWIIFAKSYLPNILDDAIAALFSAILIFVLSIRILKLVKSK